MHNKNITVILPVHRVDGDYKEMLLNSITSTEEFKDEVIISIICPSSIKKELVDLPEGFEINVIENKGDSGFCSQVNLGIEKCDTEWFTILEMDDEFKPIWYKSMSQYMKVFTDVSVFLPIIKDINVNGEFVSFTNDSSWAYGFTEMQGFLDNEVLLEYQNYQTSGGLFKTQMMKDNGMLKDNIKLTFTYELLLRLTHNGNRVMTVPKVGYQHVNLREDSLFWLYKNDETMKLTEKEVKFWLDAAKKEYFFKNNRDIKYVES
jgi:hypothetical protein